MIPLRKVLASPPKEAEGREGVQKRGPFLDRRLSLWRRLIWRILQKEAVKSCETKKKLCVISPMKRESKTLREMSSLWKVSLKAGLLRTAMTAPLPIRPQAPTITERMPSQIVLHTLRTYHHHH